MVYVVVIGIVIAIIAKLVASGTKNENTKREADEVADRLLYGRQGKEAAMKGWGCLFVIFLVIIIVFVAFITSIKDMPI